MITTAHSKRTKRRRIPTGRILRTTFYVGFICASFSEIGPVVKKYVTHFNHSNATDEEKQQWPAERTPTMALAENTTSTGRGEVAINEKLGRRNDATFADDITEGGFLNNYNYNLSVMYEVRRPLAVAGENTYDHYPEHTPAQECRLKIEELVNTTINTFLEMGEEMPPWIDWVWDMDSKFLINLKFGVLPGWSEKAFMGATWNWQDQFGNNYTTGQINRKRTKNQYHLKVVPVEIPSLHQTNQTLGERKIPQFLWATNLTYPNKTKKVVRDWVYDLRPFLKCDAIEREEKLPPNTKIGMCLRYRGNHHLIAPFIAYHRLIGVQHFWLYANEPFYISDLPESREITYIPYNFAWKKNYEVLEKFTGRSFGKTNLYQQDAQQHCLFKAKRYGLDWIMTQDVDEYLWLQQTESKLARSPGATSSSSVSILERFLKQYKNDPGLGAVRIAGWAFGGNGTERHNLMVDYTVRGKKPTGGRPKLIYRVAIAENIGVHWLFNGGKAKQIQIRNARWNHYKNPELGPYDKQGKHWNGTTVHDRSLQGKYRDLMLQWIHDHPSPLAQRTTAEEAAKYPEFVSDLTSVSSG